MSCSMQTSAVSLLTHFWSSTYFSSAVGEFFNDGQEAVKAIIMEVIHAAVVFLVIIITAVCVRPCRQCPELCWRECCIQSQQHGTRFLICYCNYANASSAAV